MPEVLSSEKILRLVEPFLAGDGPEDPQVRLAGREELGEKLATYLDLLVKWNARTNLTAVRSPEEMVTRHFGESLFAGRVMAGQATATDTVLDFGSGGGFPGLPISLLLPEVRVTLGESQGKKAAFLREAVRILGLETEVWSRRIEEMPESRRFQWVTLRAVDKMESALVEAEQRAAKDGWMLTLESHEDGLLVPGSERRRVRMFHVEQ